MTYLLFFFAGLFGANSIPHLVKGMIGEKHRTPFKNPSSAVVNVLWGAANLYISAWFFELALQHHMEFGLASGSVFIGALVIGVFNSYTWSHDDTARGK